MKALRRRGRNIPQSAERSSELCAATIVDDICPWLGWTTITVSEERLAFHWANNSTLVLSIEAPNASDRVENFDEAQVNNAATSVFGEGRMLKASRCRVYLRALLNVSDTGR